MRLVEHRLPDDVMEQAPKDLQGLIRFLSSYFEEEVDRYSASLQRRAQSPMNGPLSNYERSIVKDYLMDAIIGRLRDAEARGVPSIVAPEMSAAPR